MEILWVQSYYRLNHHWTIETIQIKGLSCTFFKEPYFIGFANNISKERQYKDFCLLSNENDFLKMRTGLLRWDKPIYLDWSYHRCVKLNQDKQYKTHTKIYTHLILMTFKKEFALALDNPKKNLAWENLKKKDQDLHVRETYRNRVLILKLIRTQINNVKK